MSLLSRSLGK